jgi:hypothetical protein
MDPVTASMLIRATGEAAALLVGLLRGQGKHAEAEQISTILSRSDATFNRILTRSGEQG